MAHVFLIEPDTSLRDTIRAVLAEEGGHTVRAVAGGQEAVDRLATSLVPQVVLVEGRLDGFYSASCLLELAYRRMLRGQVWAVLSAATPSTLERRLGRWCRLLPAPIVWLPFDSHTLLDVVASAEQRLSPPCACERVAERVAERE